jgi:CBS domain-containing protein
MSVPVGTRPVSPAPSGIRARDVMSRHVITITDDASITQAIEAMLTHHISGLPVLDSAGKLVGILSESDFLRRSEIGTEKKRGRWLTLLVSAEKTAIDFAHQHGRKAGEIMSRDPLTVDEDTTLEQIVNLMESRNVKRFPVMRGDEIVGMVTRADFMPAIARLLTGTACSDTDEHIRDGVFAVLSDAPWRPSALNLSVRNAVVTLRGSVRSDNERKATVVAAENVAGVARVDDELSTIFLPPPEEDLGGGDIASLEQDTVTEDDDAALSEET